MKLLIRALVIGSIVLAGAGLAWPAPFPWTTFSGAVSATQNVRMGRCMGGEEVAHGQMIAPNGDEYLFWAHAESGRILIAYYPGGQNQPTELGYGTGDPAKHDEFPPLRWVPFDPARHTSPCLELFPAKT